MKFYRLFFHEFQRAYDAIVAYPTLSHFRISNLVSFRKLRRAPTTYTRIRNALAITEIFPYAKIDNCHLVARGESISRAYIPILKYMHAPGRILHYGRIIEIGLTSFCPPLTLLANRPSPSLTLCLFPTHLLSLALRFCSPNHTGSR